MSAKHTPGPWAVSDFRKGRFSEGDIRDSKDRLVAISAGQNYGEWRDAEDCGDAEFLANARLIAAAPELAEALREARLQLVYLDERFPTGTTPPTIAKIDAALAKAGL